MSTQTKRTEQKFILNNGIMQYVLSVPADGLLVRLRADGRQLAASFEEGSDQPGAALQLITDTLTHLRVDPILDQRKLFKIYNPGVVYGN